MALLNYVIGVPGVRAPVTAYYKRVFYACEISNLPSGRYINGEKSRDVSNTPDVGVLMPGLLMGKETSGGACANWSLGQNTVLYDGGTSLTVSVAAATEIVRRIGATGSFVMTGPPTAAGVVKQLTITYSAVNTSTGVVTVTASNVNEVQTLTFGAAATGGTMVLRVTKPDGTTADTGAITWNATDATWLAAINTALDAALVAGAVVATGAAPDTALTFTFSGTGYAAKAIPALIQVVTLPTSAGSASVARTTTGVSGSFVVGSVVSQADGTQTPISFLEDGWGVNVTDGSGTSVTQVEWPNFPIAGVIDPVQLIGYSVMDASLQTWVKTALSTAMGGKYIYKDQF